jgi:hypothetical protein
MASPHNLVLYEPPRLPQVHYFGGRDYRPLLQALTGDVGARVIVHHKGDPPAPAGFQYEHFSCGRNQNWHYDAAKVFICNARSR